MRKIIYWVHISVDGHISGPNGEFDWPMMTDQLADYSHALDERVDTFLYGRVVWEMMSSYWPQAESMSDDAHDLYFAPIWRAKPKVVVSRTLQSADWNAQVIGSNLEEEIRALKERPGKDILLTGGAGLAASLTDLGLIDEYHIAVHPVVLGGGPRAFPEGKERLNFTLVESRTFDSRVVLLRYTR
jgi:dihydrofolate reductase